MSFQFEILTIDLKIVKFDDDNSNKSLIHLFLNECLRNSEEKASCKRIDGMTGCKHLKKMCLNLVKRSGYQ